MMLITALGPLEVASGASEGDDVVCHSQFGETLTPLHHMKLRLCHCEFLIKILNCDYKLLY